MIGGRREPYIMLMASLPSLGPLLGSRTPAISATRLEARLGLLAPEDRATLEALRSGFAWSRLKLGEDDGTFLDRVDGVMALLDSPSLKAVLHDRLELRTLIAALRRRAAGEEAPAAGLRWGYGRIAETIRSHWPEPNFGLGRTFPWITAARAKLDAGDAMGLERLVLQAAWDSADRHGEGHLFDFEAVAFYFIRWSLADRWARYDVAIATRRFEALLEAATADVLPAIESCP